MEACHSHMSRSAQSGLLLHPVTPTSSEFTMVLMSPTRAFPGVQSHAHVHRRGRTRNNQLVVRDELRWLDRALFSLGESNQF